MKQSKLQMLTTKCDTFRMQEIETIEGFYARVCDLANQAFALGSDYSNSKLVRKVLRSLLERFNIKVTAIKEANDINAMRIDDLIGSLQTFEINLEEAKKGKSKFEKNIAFLVEEIVPTEQSINSSRSVTLPLLNHPRPTIAGHEDATVIATGIAVPGDAGATPLQHSKSVRLLSIQSGSMMTQSVRSSNRLDRRLDFTYQAQFN
ncbi:hypothetical protein CXB51_024482 [Gossypium anomalum]|uniref:Gag-pol polyprotein n=1 Tax=Gossypium anomalum TaxID=47600 RepID=A0A8J5Y4A8_9ROSI|nr:hypothetical protein CXB51_024482 [Gossypium anomalum]